jgi:hypothetical protein
MPRLGWRAGSPHFMISVSGISLSLHLPKPSVSAKVPPEDQIRDSPL